MAWFAELVENVATFLVKVSLVVLVVALVLALAAKIKKQVDEWVYQENFEDLIAKSSTLTPEAAGRQETLVEKLIKNASGLRMDHQRDFHLNWLAYLCVDAGLYELAEEAARNITDDNLKDEIHYLLASKNHHQ